MMRDLEEVKQAILLLSTHPQNIAWSDFGDRGNVCTGPFRLESDEEIVEDALALAAVKIAMPKGSPLHLKLSSAVARILGCNWVTYDWLIKIVGRIMACGSFQDFIEKNNLSIAMQSGYIQ